MAAQSIVDKVICEFNSMRYGISEPLFLAIVRQLNKGFYSISPDEPLISVYAPTYNRADLLLERAVKSVLAQTYKNFELIIVGDCCTDDTEDRVLGIKDARIRFYNIKNRSCRYPPTVENHWLAGPVVAANRALSMVKGKWIARIDDDDIWTPNHLERLLAFAQKNNYEFVSSSYVSQRDGKEVVIDLKDQSPRIGGTQTWLYRAYLKFMKYNINCFRKAWNRVNDTDLQDRLFKSGVRMGFLDAVTCYVLPRPDETTIGLEAYKRSKEEKLRHFEFE